MYIQTDSWIVCSPCIWVLKTPIFCLLTNPFCLAFSSAVPFVKWELGVKLVSHPGLYSLFTREVHLQMLLNPLWWLVALNILPQTQGFVLVFLLRISWSISCPSCHYLFQPFWWWFFYTAFCSIYFGGFTRYAPILGPFHEYRYSNGENDIGSDVSWGRDTSSSSTPAVGFGAVCALQCLGGKIHRTVGTGWQLATRMLLLYTPVCTV